MVPSVDRVGPLLSLDAGGRAARRRERDRRRIAGRRRSSTAPSGWSSRRSPPSTSTSTPSTTSLAQLAEELEPVSVAAAAWRSIAPRPPCSNDDAQACWQMPIGSLPQLAPAFEQLLSQRLSALYDPLVLWWTEGSSIVEPSCLIVEGPAASGHVCRAPRRLVGRAAVAVDPGARRGESAARATRWSTRRRRPAFARRRRPTSAGCAASTRTRSSSGPRSGSGSSPTASAGTATAKSRAGWCATRSPISCRTRASRTRSTARASASAQVNEHLDRAAARSARRRPQRQHRRRPAGARQPLRGPVGGRQPGLPMARRPAAAVDARPQPGGVGGGDRAATRTPSREPSAASRR